MKQADALGSYLSISDNECRAGEYSSFVAQLAQSLSSSHLISSNPLDDSAVLNQAFSASLQSVQPDANISEVSSAVTLLQSADNLLVQTINAGGTPNILAVSLAKNQQAVEDAIIEGYSNPSIDALSTLAIHCNYFLDSTRPVMQFHPLMCSLQLQRTFNRRSERLHGLPGSLLVCFNH